MALTWIILDSGLGSSWTVLHPGGGAAANVTGCGRVRGGGGSLDEGLALIGRRLLHAADAPSPDFARRHHLGGRGRRLRAGCRYVTLRLLDDAAGRRREAAGNVGTEPGKDVFFL